MLKGLILAILSGTVAGTAFPAIILALAIFGSSGSAADLRAGTGIAIATILIPAVLVSASALLLGLPTTFALKRLGWENEAAYMIAGAVLGFVVPGAILVIAEQDGRVFLSAAPAGLLGAFSGAMTGRSWWRSYREGVAGSEA